MLQFEDNNIIVISSIHLQPNTMQNAYTFAETFYDTVKDIGPTSTNTIKTFFTTPFKFNIFPYFRKSEC